MTILQQAVVQQRLTEIQQQRQNYKILVELVPKKLRQLFTIVKVQAIFRKLKI